MAKSICAGGFQSVQQFGAQRGEAVGQARCLAYCRHCQLKRSMPFMATMSKDVVVMFLPVKPCACMAS